jgi:hypothetical protein
MARLTLRFALVLALPLLAGCEDADAGFRAVDSLESLGGAFGPPQHAPPHAPAGCPADKSVQRCP